jgi:hypothetical protein
MNLREYIITACPFPQSDLTATYKEYAPTEEKALDQFAKRYPAYRVREVKEQ